MEQLPTDSLQRVHQIRPEQTGALVVTQKRLYTYSVTCVVQIQFTFTDDQVDADEDAPTPTTKALAELQNELSEYIGQNYAVNNVEIEDGAGGCILLGVECDGDQNEHIVRCLLFPISSRTVQPDDPTSC